MKHEVNKRGFIFEGIRRWCVTNVATSIHGYSYLISLDIVVGYRKLRSFQGTQVNLVRETREAIETCETRYHVSIGDTKSLESSCRIIPKTSNHAENTLILVVPPNFPNITGDKISLFIYWGHNVRPGRHFSKFIDQEIHRNFTSAGYLDRMLWYRTQYRNAFQKYLPQLVF